MSITDWPENERPREKLLTHGPSALTDAELLAIFLRTGTRGKTAVDMARDLLSQFGNLRSLLAAKQKDFCQSHGLGIAKFTQLQAVLEMGRRHLYETLKRNDVLKNPDDVRHYLITRLRAYEHEVFACLFLDNQHRVISFDELAHGSLNSAHISPREVVKRALAHNAAAVIFAHNHPSGMTKPSQADKALTQKLQKALQLVDIRVIDHMIIGEDPCTSFAELGLL